MVDLQLGRSGSAAFSDSGLCEINDDAEKATQLNAEVREIATLMPVAIRGIDATVDTDEVENAGGSGHSTGTRGRKANIGFGEPLPGRAGGRADCHSTTTAPPCPEAHHNRMIKMQSAPDNVGGASVLLPLSALRSSG